MGNTRDSCPECGTPLHEGTCPRCLLHAGLASGTDFSAEDPALAETLSATPTPSTAEEAMTRSTPAGDEPGIGDYRDLHALRDWSGGTVYRAYHRGLDRPVLLRVLEASSGNSDRDDFLRRAETLSQLNHPNIVETLEAGVAGELAFVAEEFLEGPPISGFLPRSFRQRAAEGFFPGTTLMSAMREVALGLHEIHKLGLRHGRLNPDSIVVDEDGVARLIDLGVGSDANDERFALPNRNAEGAVAEDIYRLGATFCFIATGKLPSELGQFLNAIAVARRIKRLNRGLTREFCLVLGRCLVPAEAPQGDPIDQSPAAPAAYDSATSPGPAVGESPLPDSMLDGATGNDAATVQHGLRNPYAASRPDGELGFRSADEIASELDRLLRVRPQRASWSARGFSAFLECLILAVVIGLILARLSAAAGGPSARPMLSAGLLFGIPLCYVVILETLLGWTVARRVFGLRLLERSGERPAVFRRLARVLLKTLIAAVALLLPGLVLPLVSLPGNSASGALGVVTGLTLLLPWLLLYLPALWLPSRWTYYDLLAGVTWGEEVALKRDLPAREKLETQRPAQNSVAGNIDQYDVFDMLGRGGMGRVYRGHDRILHRDVAIKVLADPLVENPLLLERFQREARLAAKISHPNVAKVFGNGLWNKTPYIAMELVQGRNLQELTRERGRIGVDVAWDYIIQAAAALRAANRRGVVHRDIKPANLMIAADGRVKVTDFGISRQVTSVEQTVTEVGTVVGTPAYMSPEQAMGKDVDSRSDIYSLGMTLYYLLCGKVPFKAANPMEMIAQQMTETPPPLLDEVEELSFEQHLVLEKMIAKRPEDRYQDYDQLLSALERVAPGLDRLGSPLKRVAAELCNWGTGYLFFSLTMFTIFAWGGALGLDRQQGTMAVGIAMLILLIAFVSVYLIGIAWKGATPGKQLLGVRVRLPGGERIGLFRSIIRFVVAYPVVAINCPIMIHYVIRHTPASRFELMLGQVAMTIQFMTLFVSVVLLWLHPKRRTLHDLAAGTIVTRER